MPDSFLVFENTFEKAGESQISSATYAAAYHAAVDPGNERTTLAAWKALNGFDNGEDVHVTFRDTKDLGYGRDMYARRRIDGSIAVYADNYLVQLTPGDATGYGPLNLAAARARDRDFHVTTSALEFSPIDRDDPSSHKIVKLFLYGPPDASGEQRLAMAEDLDGRGAKFLPTACFGCHGGSAYPLQADGSFALDTLNSLKMNILDLQTLEFGDLPEADQQARIKAINRMVYDSYAEMDLRPDDERAKWSNAFALELSTGAYGDDFSRDTFDDRFVPTGWRRTLGRPEAVEQLYQEVVRPHCIGCHSLRGNNTAEEFVDVSSGIVWDEDVNGDLSGDHLAPTGVAFSTGTNTVAGSMGAPVGIPEDIRDYFTFTIGPQQFLSSITLSQYVSLDPEVVIADAGYAHIDDGPTGVIPTQQTALDFLGGALTTPDLVGLNLLDFMAAGTPEGGGTGFDVPLGPGVYTFNIQQTGPELTGYSIDFEIMSTQVSLANAITFSSYEKFISYNDQIIDKVYRRGNMPMSLVNFSRFWANPAGAPAFLASFLEGFDVFDSDGRIGRPGMPVPRPGDDRTVSSPVVQDGGASLFSETLNWHLVSTPVGAVAELSDANTEAVRLTADTPGDYVLMLGAANARGVESARVTLTIDNMMRPRQEELSFDDVVTVLNDSSIDRACASCHRISGEFPGIPVVFDEPDITVLYKDVLERVNLAEPENSVLLRKPSSLQHGGGMVLDRSNPLADANYVTLLNWIRNGAPCGRACD